MEPPNKGHFGEYINSDVVSFVERLSSLCESSGKQFFGTLTRDLCRLRGLCVPISKEAI